MSIHSHSSSDPDCPPHVVQVGTRPEARLDLGRLIEASRSVGASPNVRVMVDGDPVAELDPKVAAQRSGLGAQPMRAVTGQWTVDRVFQRRPFATFHAVTEGLEGELTHRWFVNGQPLETPEGQVDARGLVMTYRIAENRIIRLVLSYEALADNISADDLLNRILDAVPMPEVPLHESHRTRAIQ